MPGLRGHDGGAAQVHAPWQRLPECAVELLFDMLSLGPGDVFCDLGCGDGWLLERAARARPGLAAVYGVELDPVLVLEARTRLDAVAVPARVVHGSVGVVAPGLTVDAVFANFLPPGAAVVGDRVLPALRPGARLVSAGWPAGEPVLTATVAVPEAQRAGNGGDRHARLHLHRV